MIDCKSIATLFKQQSFFPHFHLVFSRFSRIIYLKSVKIQTCRLLYLFVLAYLDNWVFSAFGVERKPPGFTIGMNTKFDNIHLSFSRGQ